MLNFKESVSFTEKRDELIAILSLRYPDLHTSMIALLDSTFDNAYITGGLNALRTLSGCPLR
jgi:hypothetical protein